MRPVESIAAVNLTQKDMYDGMPNGWMTEPGENCIPLEPISHDVVKTLPPSDVCVFDQVLPPLKDDVKDMNLTYLELTSGLSANKWIAVGGAITGAPLVVILMPFVLWEYFVESDINFMLWLKLLTVAIMVLGTILYAGLFTTAFFSPVDEPVRFCRRDQRVYRYCARRFRLLGMDIYLFGKPEVKIYEWVQCRAEVVRKVILNGKTARFDCFLELAVLDPSAKMVVERFRVGDRDVYSDFTQRIFLWETIRRYMQEGIEHLPLPPLRTHRGSFVDCIEDFNPFSMPAKSSPGTQRVFSYFFAAMLWTLSLIYLQMVIFRWISIKSSRKVDWGDLEQTTFLIAQNDPALQRSFESAIVAPHLWEEEIKRRRRAAFMWLTTVLLQCVGLWWYFLTPRYYS